MTCLNKARLGLAVAAAGGKVYAIGGWGKPQNIPGGGRDRMGLDSVEVFDPARPDDGWVLSPARLRMGRAFLKAAAVDGRLYAVGGYRSGSRANCEAWDPNADGGGQWAAIASLLVPRDFFALGVLGGRLIAAGGCRSQPCKSAETYDPAEDAWHAAAPMRVARFQHAGADVARRDSAEDFSGLNARHGTAMDRILIPAYCFAIP